MRVPRHIGSSAPCAFWFLVIAICGLGSGCSTHAKRIALPRSLFYEGQIEQCRAELEKLQKSHRHDRDVANLDLAIVDLVDGRNRQSEMRLKEVRERFDYLEQTSVTEQTVSMWTDDSARSYAGEDYEKILLRVYLALASLMGDGVDAESYTLQIQEKHDAILSRLGQEQEPAVEAGEDVDEGASVSDGTPLPATVPLPPSPVAVAPTESKAPYRGIPIGFYLRGMLREQTHQNYDDALRSYRIASELIPDSMPLRWDIERVQNSVHSNPGHGVVYVFAMVGRGPYKVEVAELPTSDALLIADRIVSAVGKYSVPPTIAPIKVPAVMVPPSEIDSVFVTVDGQRIGPTTSIADIGLLAEATFLASRNTIVARAVARRVIKKATVVTAKSSMGSNQWTSLGMDVAGVAWEATEAADTRCWGLLPRDIQVLRVETPTGTRSIRLHPSLMGQNLGAGQAIDVPVYDGRNTYVLAWFPDAHGNCKVQCSESLPSSSPVTLRLGAGN